MDIEKNLVIIAETMSFENKAFKPEEILPYLKKAVNHLVLIRDSRFCSKKDAIQLVDSMMERSLDAVPFFISATQWDQLYDEAGLWLAGNKKGELVDPITLVDGVSDFYDNGFEAGLKIGDWPEFSSFYRIAKRELTTVNGIPGHGKSEFMDAIMVGLAMEHDMKFAIFSPENYPHEVHVEKLLSKFNGLPFHKGPTVRMSKEDVSKGLAWIDLHFTFIHPHEDELHLEAVLGLAEKAIEIKKVDGLLIDPWNEIEHNVPRDMNETRYIGQCLTKCRRFARNNNICFWIVAHPAKLYKDRDKSSGQEKAEYRTPTPYDLAGSAHWFNKSDNCLCVYRNRDNSVDVHVQKIKFKMRGKPGIAHFNYDVVSGRYAEKYDGGSSGFTDL